MTAAEILQLSLITLGKFREGPTTGHPAGRWLVAQRVSKENANYTSPNGRPISVYQHFFPTNPRTPAQQANRTRFATASKFVADGLLGTPPAVLRIMRRDNLSLRAAQMRYILSRPPIEYGYEE